MPYIKAARVKNGTKCSGIRSEQKSQGKDLRANGMSLQKCSRDAICGLSFWRFRRGLAYPITAGGCVGGTFGGDCRVV
jgi:hypothetical protein